MFNPESIISIVETFNEDLNKYVATATDAELKSHIKDNLHPAILALAEGLLQAAAQGEQVTAELLASSAGSTIQHAMVSGILLEKACGLLSEFEIEGADELVEQIKAHLGIQGDAETEKTENQESQE